MAGNDVAGIRDKHRVGEPEALDRRGDLLDLLLGVGARVARVGSKGGNLALDQVLIGLHVTTPVLLLNARPPYYSQAYNST